MRRPNVTGANTQFGDKKGWGEGDGKKKNDDDGEREEGGQGDDDDDGEREEDGQGDLNNWGEYNYELGAKGNDGPGGGEEGNSNGENVDAGST